MPGISFQQLCSRVEDLENSIVNLSKWARVSEPMVETADWPYQSIEYLGLGSVPSISWTPYGLHSSPPPDSVCLLVCLQGDEGARVHMAGSPNKRPVTLEEGEVVMYHPKTGSRVHFKDNGDIKVTSSTLVSIVAPETTMSGNLTVTGDVTVEDGGITVESGSITTEGILGNITANLGTIKTLVGEITAIGKPMSTHVHAATGLTAPSGGGAVTGSTAPPT